MIIIVNVEQTKVCLCLFYDLKVFKSVMRVMWLSGRQSESRGAFPIGAQEK